VSAANGALSNPWHLGLFASLLKHGEEAGDAMAGEQAGRGSRPDPGVVTQHPQGPGALRRIDPGAPGRSGKGGPEVSPVARSVADGVLFRLEAGGVFANPKALDTSRIHNKYTTSDSHAPKWHL
jgi:hypothetical protein